jgi:UDP-N-acetylglucosamine--N-acetylmuramyl-(pentapeptide) pyrophosphoryl-undecaprenol N-acetylglucosamine transferase
VSTSYRVLIACGGTGGHLFPGIAVAEAMRVRGHEVLLLISEKNVDAEASAKYSHLTFATLPAVAKPSTLSLRMLPFLWKTWHSIRRCKSLLRSFRADAVLGMGGFTSLPPVYAGHMLGLHTFVHDSNARPGRANVLTSRFCTRVLLGLDAAKSFFPKRETITTGTPVRPEILHLPTREEAARTFGLDPSKTTILVTGGSQGARRLNELAAEAASKLPDDFQVLHIAGALDRDRVIEIAGSRPHHKILGFCDQMPAAYALADLVIARSGASSLTEIALCGQPSILVPFPYAADDHQTRNAEVFAQAGAAKLIQERDLDAVQLAAMAIEILAHEPTRESMSAAARTLAFPDAADRVCSAIDSTLSRA